jgi:DNA polymerase III epsilon subunit-like protein
MNLFAIDTETGGLNPATDALLSIAAVPSWDAEPFNIYILPEGVVTEGAIEVNGYSPELWQQRNAVSLKTAMLEFALWLHASGARERGAFPLAHNAIHDRNFLAAAQQRSGHDLELPWRWRCSLVSVSLFKDAGLLPLGMPLSLDALGEHTGYWQTDPRGAKHDALQDARCCLHGYQWLVARLMGE